jgi:two-component system cell cycle response regulator
MIGQVLVVEPVMTNRIVMQARLASAHYGVTCSDSLEQAITLIPDTQPEFIFVNANLGLHALEQLRAAVNATPNGLYVPIVAIGNTNDGHVLSDIIAHGGQDLMPWPINSELMRARLRSMMRQMRFFKELSIRGEGMPVVRDQLSEIVPPKPIMIVARTIDRAANWAAKVQSNMPSHSVLASSYAGVLDPHRRGINGTVYMLVADPVSEPEDVLHIISTLKTRSNGASAHYLAAFPAGADHLAAAALDMGAADIVFTDCHKGDIAARLDTLTRLSAEISSLSAILEDSMRLSLIDPLTGLHNRRYSDHNLARLAGDAQMKQKPLALMLFDIDHFKSVNDLHGHLTGDHVLTCIAATLRAELDGCELLARIGGEEFLAALPATNAEEAIELANKVRQAVEKLEFSAQSTDAAFKVTVSAGITVSDGKQSPRKMIGYADEALYRAKSDGRNRAHLSPSRVAA